MAEHRTSRSLGAAAVLAAALLLTGCAGSPAPAGDTAGRDDVASLRTPAAPAEAPSPSATARPGNPGTGRPQLRLDMTDAETQVYWDGYGKCLKEHGHRMVLGRGPYSVDQNDTSPTARAAERACAGKLPEQPPETQPETNPHYAEDSRAFFRCAARAGLRIHPVAGGWTYDENGAHGTAMSARKQEEIELSCKVEAFGGKNS
ncbi:hypothetical protein ABZ883_10995 [Streptomyces sp. NPDC046977]|uniref:hypothetical protein n=1 Tax=Streptomyces sp. NPDC046977 TaxID=3154703 RepID=UPI0033EC0BFE